MKKRMFYCGKDSKGNYINFSKNKNFVMKKGHENIFRVNILQCSNPTDDTYWSWWDNQQSDFLFIQQSELGLRMKLPFIETIAEKQGKGKLVPIRIEQI